MTIETITYNTCHDPGLSRLLTTNGSSLVNNMTKTANRRQNFDYVLTIMVLPDYGSGVGLVVRRRISLAVPIASRTLATTCEARAR